MGVVVVPVLNLVCLRGCLLAKGVALRYLMVLAGVVVVLVVLVAVLFEPFLTPGANWSRLKDGLVSPRVLL